MKTALIFLAIIMFVGGVVGVRILLRNSEHWHCPNCGYSNQPVMKFNGEKP